MIKIALTQLNPVYNKNESLKNIEYYSNIASKNNSDLIVFPEYYMFYSSNKKDIINNSETLEDNYIKNVKKIALNNNINIITGINEKNENNYYDTAVYINNNGELLNYYRKTHLYDAFNYKESNIYNYGNGPFNIFKINDINLGILICYDIRFPEVFRKYSLNNADCIIIISGWFSGPVKEEQWLSLVSVRALENTVYIGTSNLIGDGFTGITSFVDPIGVITNRCSEDYGIIYSIVDNERIKKVRKIMPLLNQRRKELYSGKK